MSFESGSGGLMEWPATNKSLAGTEITALQRSTQLAEDSF